ncbi:Rrf2 family transcriptional regulator [Fulvivirgaceae bacterium BMA10]|uniref:Rrf2 family transcriptional regulator n=1 Tax=Splendidivirga corallicola TaxID=3051826 RepID=A0ABT8KS27_9BACT|nr:Rrf2 family transcriptional regulator [Fulvivirgaceae bacterium BMA10]
MIKSKFSISLHILTLLALDKDSWLTSAHIAGSLNVNPVIVRKEIMNLKSGNLIESKEGKNGGVRLLKDPSEIYLSDIFQLVKGKHNVLSLSKNTPNPACPVGRQINEKLESVFDNIDDAIIRELSKQTLDAFKNQF